MEKQNDKISLGERILAILSSIVSIMLINGDWVNIYHMPVLLGDMVKTGYTLYEMEGGFSFLAILLIIIHIINIIVALTDSKKIIKLTEGAVGGNVGVVVGFIILVFFINAEMYESTYLGTVEIKPAANLYLLMGFSVFALICCKVTRRDNTNNIAPPVQKIETPKKKCKQCGAELTKGSTFCGECGSKVIVQNYAKFCENCGAKMPENTIFCPECRHRNVTEN